MRLSVPRVLAAAWALWRRDHDLLLRVAAPFLFLPSLALQLLAPAPAPPDGADLATIVRLQVENLSAHLGLFMVALAATQYGLAALVTLYCDARASDVRGVLRRAAGIWPRYILASFLVGLPQAVGLLAFVVPGLLVAARTLLVGPLLVAGRPLGAAAAIGRSVRATAGQTLPLTALAIMCWGGQFLARGPFAELDRYLRLGHDAGRVALAIVDAAAAGVDMLGGIAGVLIAVAAYRSLASTGT